MNKLYFETNRDWEKWLEYNYNTENELWLIYYKKHTGKTSVSYEESVQTALCFGWIDSIIKKLDEDSYARKFNPRNENSVWSESNKKRIDQLIKEGKMKPAGLRLVESAKQNGNWDKVITRPEIDFTMPQEFANALKKHPRAEEYFNSLSQRHQREYLIWIIMAKRDDTRERRIEKSLEMLLEKRKLGLK